MSDGVNILLNRKRGRQCRSTAQKNSCYCWMSKRTHTPCSSISANIKVLLQLSQPRKAERLDSTSAAIIKSSVGLRAGPSFCFRLCCALRNRSGITTGTLLKYSKLHLLKKKTPQPFFSVDL